MMRFWLVTFDLEHVPTRSAAWPVPPGASRLAMEVLFDQNEWAVLFSTADDLQSPTTLQCFFGFTNAARPCNVWHDRGFPLVDAAIDHNPSTRTLNIGCPCFHRESSMQYESALLQVSGIDLALSSGSSLVATKFNPSYAQEFRAPDAAQPNQLIRRQAVAWTPARTSVLTAKAPWSGIRLDLGSPPARNPVLAPLKTATLEPVAGWIGEIQQPRRQVGPVLPSVDIGGVFGVPTYRFENVEVLGFRIDLAQFGADFSRDLAAMIEPLNFHLSAPGAGTAGAAQPAADFDWRIGAPTILIELLRYGRMKSQAPMPPMTADDFQSQHELVVRLLVGRVDDDTGQAYQPSVFVPAIFVDNPWSKLLGRDVLGYDKRLASFCTGPNGQLVSLLPDGRVRGPAGPFPGWPGAKPGPVPLGDVSSIRLLETSGRNECNGPSVLDLDYDSPDHTDPAALVSADRLIGFGASVLAAVRWRLSDFGAEEFARAFATGAIGDSLRTFHSVQVAPLVGSGLEQTWIAGRFVLGTDLGVSIPLGSADLTLHASQRVANQPLMPYAPDSWNRLCRMLGDGQTAQLHFPFGSWYRLSCSMELTVDDQVSWSNRPCLF